jgi:hypothetical protein
LHKAESEKAAYCKCHLRVAIQRLTALFDRIRDQNGNITTASLVPWKSILRDYIFDLNDIVPFLQRRVQGYVFFNGGSNSYPHSWEFFQLSRSLALQSAFTGSGPQFGHKTALIAAIFVLRQALELRFERLIGVYPSDAKGKGPRLKHGFHQEFINTCPKYFISNGFNIADLKPVYDWCSEIVHRGYQPYAWQIDWALDLCGQLLGPHPAPPLSAWSVANGVEIVDLTEMQDAFENYFLSHYEHGSWRIMRIKPEALVKGWRPEILINSSIFKSVVHRRTITQRIKDFVVSWGR